MSLSKAIYTHRKWLVTANLILNLGLTAAFCNLLKEHLDNHVIHDLGQRSDQISQHIQTQLKSYARLLHVTSGLVHSNSGTISRQQWQAFAEQLDLEENLPGVQGLGFAKAIQPDELDAHIASVRNEGFPTYSVYPPGQRNFYSAIVYLEPFSGRNLQAFGFDMFSEPVRRAAMKKARDTGEVTMSGKVELVQENDSNRQPGMLIYLPVYRIGMPTTTLEQRQAALTGWAYIPFRMNDLMHELLKDWSALLQDKITLKIYSGQQITPAELLYSTAPHEEGQATMFYQLRKVELNGSQWLLVFLNNERYGNVVYLPVWLSFLSGILISALVSSLLWSLLSTRARAARMAIKLNGEIIKSKQQLNETVFRFKYSLEGSGLGLWDWDIANDTIYYSSVWKKMLGYEDDEIPNIFDEWLRRIHPDDKPSVLNAINAYIDGRSPVYNYEHRLCCKDGSYKWILTRGIAVERDAENKPVRMLGTHADIDARKKLELSLQETSADLIEAQQMAHVGNWSVDLVSGKVTWSQEVYRIYGLDPANPPPNQQEQENLYTPDSWQQVTAATLKNMEDGIPFELDMQTITPSGNGWITVKGESLLDKDGRVVTLRGTVADITTKKNHEKRIEQLGKLYAAISACNHAIVHCKTQDSLFNEICRIVVEFGGMKMAWIGLVDAHSKKIFPVNAYGNGTEYLEGIMISADPDVPEGRGPTGTATRENHPVWIQDFTTNPATAPWQDRAASHGWAASAALPLCRNDTPIGALTFYSSNRDWFSEEIRALLLEMADDISYALDKLDTDAIAIERLAQLAEAEQRFRAVVEQSITGAFIIQDNKLVYANPRLAQLLGYEDAEALHGKSVFDLIAPKDHAHIQKNMQSLLAGEITQTASAFSAIRKDGSLINVGANSSMATYEKRPAVVGIIQDTSSSEVADRHIQRYVTQLENIFVQTVGLATTLSEMRDPYTAGHEQRVAEIAVAIGQEMGLDKQMLEGLRIGGYLHDVGKMRIPIDILSKPGRLTASEYELIKEHARAGYEVLKEVEFPWPVAKIALQHHERFDGSGYPQGLKGHDILLEARITAVADVIESMASHRPYRPGKGITEALAEIERGKGTAYDPDVAEACLRLFREKGYTLATT